MGLSYGDLKVNDVIEFKPRSGPNPGRWRPGVVDFLPSGDTLLVKASDEDMKYSLHYADVRK